MIFTYNFSLLSWYIYIDTSSLLLSSKDDISIHIVLTRWKWLCPWFCKCPLENIWPCLVLIPSKWGGCLKKKVYCIPSNCHKIWRNDDKPLDLLQYTYIDFKSTQESSCIWVNYNISLTWIKAIWGWFPLLTMISSEGEQWGRYNLPRNMFVHLQLISNSTFNITSFGWSSIIHRKRKRHFQQQIHWSQTYHLVGKL